MNALVIILCLAVVLGCYRALRRVRPADEQRRRARVERLQARMGE